MKKKYKKNYKKFDRDKFEQDMNANWVEAAKVNEKNIDISL